MKKRALTETDKGIFGEVSESRRRNMQAIKAQNTKPEIKVRSLVHRLGYRFRLHRGDLPGKPDLVFVSRKKALFVHGCFWHSHSDLECPIVHKPKSNQKYWSVKLEKNRARDAVAVRKLTESGWKVLTVWECELDSEPKLRRRLNRFLSQ